MRCHIERALNWHLAPVSHVSLIMVHAEQCIGTIYEDRELAGWRTTSILLLTMWAWGSASIAREQDECEPHSEAWFVARDRYTLEVTRMQEVK